MSVISEFCYKFESYLKTEYGVVDIQNKTFVMENVVCNYSVEEDEKAFTVEFKFTSEITGRSIPYMMRFDKRCVSVDQLLHSRVEILIEKIFAFKAANKKKKVIE